MPDDAKPPFNLPAKAKYETVVAKLTADLDKASETAEDLADRVKSLYKDDVVSIQPAREAYDAARHEYNGISTFLVAILVQGKKPPEDGYDMDGAISLLNKFQGAANLLIQNAAKPKPAAAVRRAAAAKASAASPLGEITSIFDAIFKGIEWFIGRKDKQKQSLADLIEGFEIRPWSQAGTQRPKFGKSGGSSDKPTSDEGKASGRAAKKTTRRP